MIRTLVVEDDFRVAELHCAYVERLPGFALVGSAHTGVEALAGVDRLRPDLLLLDFYLPDLPGLEVLRRLREEDHPPVDVIAITAARDVDHLRAAMRGGVVHYLIKPFRMAAFEEKLASYASAHARLARMGEADQGEVDRIFGTLRVASRGAALPKGLSDATLGLVVQALRGARSGLAATDVADAAGLSRVTARRYLDHLCRLGTAELTMRYGGRGRPEHRYRLLTGGRDGAFVQDPTASDGAR
jgi:response regulator of citrate/malate metabolism